MGFWEMLETLLGHSQDAGPTKEAVEAVLLEAQGKDEAAKETAMETAVGIASGIIHVVKFDGDCKVAAAGKAAFEEAVKQIERSEFTPISKDAFDTATKKGFSPIAAKAIAAAAVASSAKAATAGEEEISSKGPAPAPLFFAAVDTDPPKRGHHVINNGVRKVFPKMIDNFLQLNSPYFKNKSFVQLVTSGFITNKTVVYLSHNHPFSPADDKFIQETAVDAPPGQHDDDPNAKEYGELMSSLRLGVSTYMTDLFLGLVNGKVTLDHLDAYDINGALAISSIIHEINSKDVYVDNQALGWWIKYNKGSKQKFDQVHGNVYSTFEKLSHKQGAIAITWVRDLYGAYLKVNK